MLAYFPAVMAALASISIMTGIVPPSLLPVTTASWSVFFTAAALVCYMLPARASALTAGAILFFAFTGAMSYRWMVAESNKVCIMGLIQFQDTAAYYRTASAMLEGQELPLIGTWRPIAHSYLSFALLCTGRHLRLTLLLISALAAACLAFAAARVRRVHGRCAAAVFLLVCITFYHRFVGLAVTESWGLIFGALSVGLLWLPTPAYRPVFGVVSVLLLSVALNARAGAFFALPLVAGCVFFSIRFRDLRRDAILVAILITAMLIPFFLNRVLTRSLSNGTTNNANFNLTLYGLVFGGDYRLAITNGRYPNMPFPELVDAAGRDAWHEIREHPSVLMRGSARAYAEQWRRSLSFIDDQTLRHIVLVLLIMGVIYSTMTFHRCPLSRLAASSALGMLLSVPFLPPWDNDHMRVYAATIPFIAVMPALAISFLLRQLGARVFGGRWSRPNRTAPQPAPHRSYPIALASITVILPLLPFWFRYVKPRPMDAVQMTLDSHGMPAGPAPIAPISVPGACAMELTLRTGSVLIIGSQSAPCSLLAPLTLDEKTAGDALNTIEVWYPEGTRVWRALAKPGTVFSMCSSHPVTAFVFPASLLANKANGDRIAMRGSILKPLWMPVFVEQSLMGMVESILPGNGVPRSTSGR